MIKNIMFDLDGTLLPMDMDTFIEAYFGLMCKKLAPHGYDPEKLVKAIWAGTEAMTRNDGTMTNEERFWKSFPKYLGEKVLDDMPLFDDYYRNEFNKVQASCGYTPKAAQVVTLCKRLGLRCVLATSPIFPTVATEARMSWAGLKPEDFELYTTYENSTFSKPNPEYYREILEKLDMKAEESIMVGNDVTEDMVAEQLGFKVFLLTDCIINKRKADISVYPHGNFDDLITFIINTAE